MEIENWEQIDNALVRHLAFENQTELAEFVLEVAKYSDEVGHHADMQISEYRKLKLSITTHDQNKVTERDYNWVNAIEEKIDVRY